MEVVHTQDRKDKEAYLHAYQTYAAATSCMEAAALVQLSIAAIFAGIKIGVAEAEKEKEQEKERENHAAV